jgi:hypothetical protein
MADPCVRFLRMPIMDVTPGHKEICVVNWSWSSIHPTYINLSRPTPSAL